MSTVAGSFLRKKKILGITEINYRERQNQLVRVRINDWDLDENTHQWCDENFGDKWIWSSPTQTNYADLYFANDEDAFLFKLKFDTLATT